MKPLFIDQITLADEVGYSTSRSITRHHTNASMHFTDLI